MQNEKIISGNGIYHLRRLIYLLEFVRFQIIGERPAQVITRAIDNLKSPLRQRKHGIVAMRYREPRLNV